MATEIFNILNRRTGVDLLAALIYQASDPTLERIPEFSARNADALADMRRLADAEVAS